MKPSEFPSTERLSWRVKQYWFEDGLAEAVIGAGFLLLALVFALSTRWAQPWSGVIRALVIFAFVLGNRWVVQRLKWRITYPRTGYLAYPRSDKATRMLWMLVAFVMGTTVVFLGAVLLSRNQERAYIAGLTVVLVLLYLFLAQRQAWTRGMFYAGVILLAGAVAVLLLSSPFWREAVLQGCVHFALVGLAQIVGGLLTLRGYLRRHPSPVEGES